MITWSHHQIMWSISIPQEEEASPGEIRQNDKCLDTLGNQHLGTVVMYSCHGTGGNQVRMISNNILILVICLQAWTIIPSSTSSEHKLLKHESLCLTVTTDISGLPVSLLFTWTLIGLFTQVTLQACNDDSHQWWDHTSNEQLVHSRSGLCLHHHDNGQVISKVCDDASPIQRWKFLLININRWYFVKL